MVSPPPDSGLPRSFFRRLAHDSPGLLRAILRFNAEAAKAAGLNGETKKWQGLVKGSNRARARLLDGGTGGFWDFEEESRRLALLDLSTFERLMLHWGAAFCAPGLNRVVRRAELEDLEQKLSPGLLAFARGRGRFCMADRCLPLVTPKTDDLARQVPWYGFSAFGVCSAFWPDSLKRIQETRLTALWGRYDLAGSMAGPDSGDGPEAFQAVWLSMKKILLKEVAPEWTPCFS